MCLEHSLNYTVTLLGTVESPVAVSAEIGMELPFEDGVLKGIHGSVQTLIYCSGPDYRGMNVGDTGGILNTYDGTVNGGTSLCLPTTPNLNLLLPVESLGLCPKTPLRTIQLVLEPICVVHGTTLMPL